MPERPSLCETLGLAPLPPVTAAPPGRATRWHVYIVRCADDSLYTGCTNDLVRRVDAHNAGKGARYTRSRRPVQLVWSVRVKDRSAALSREARIKQLTRREKLALVEMRGRRGRPAARGKVAQ